MLHDHDDKDKNDKGNDVIQSSKVSAQLNHDYTARLGFFMSSHAWRSNMESALWGKLTSEGVSEVSEEVNERAVRANERTDERVTQYSCPNSWLFCPTVVWAGKALRYGLELP